MTSRDRPESAQGVIDKLVAAWNLHDLEGFLANFAPGYDSRWPIHPDRDFVGAEHVRERWSANFERMPDFRAELLGLVVSPAGDAWTELRWTGTRPDGSRFASQGVVVYTIRDGLITAGRLYLEALPDPGTDA